MNPAELRDRISNTISDYWHPISAGPFFHDSPYYGDDSYSAGHYNRVVLSEDVDISLEWGLPAGHGGDETGHLWARENFFPDPTVRSFWIDVFYRGALADRVRALDVDGGRAYLPNYRNVRTDNGTADIKHATWAYRVENWPYALTRLVTELSGLHEFDDYFARAGLERVSS